jgi:dihydrofolate reductase
MLRVYAREVAMRRVRYSVAMSLDGYILGPKGDVDWIVQDPEIDFPAMFAQFDTLLIGRRTWEFMGSQGSGKGGGMYGLKAYVFSRTLRPSDCRGATLVGENGAELVAKLRQEPGKDIWLFGGGELFRSLHEAGLVDTVEVGIIPHLLGGGVPLVPVPAKSAKLALTEHRIYSQTGIVSLKYAVQPPAASKRRKRAS